MTRRPAIIAACIILLAAATACGLSHLDVLRLADERRITFNSMIDELQPTRIVLVGEGHNIPAHHALQLKVIRHLDEKGKRPVIALEMFPAEKQAILDSWVAGSMPEEQFVREYLRVWSEPWKLYRDIFIYARDRKLPMAGVNVPIEVVRKVGRQGFRALDEKDRQMLPPDITCNVDPTYRAYIRRMFTMHRMQEREFEHFCEAQQVWNKGMAWRLEEYLRKRRLQNAVLLTGLAHAVKDGVPEHLKTEKQLVAVILPEVLEGKLGKPTANDADYLVLR